jgi:hypothetical protein
MANGEALRQRMFDHSNDTSANKNNVQRTLTVRCNRRKTLRLLESETADNNGVATWTSRNSRNASRMNLIQITILIAKQMISKTCNERAKF